MEVSREDIARRSEERLLVGGPLSICEAIILSSVRGSKLPLETWDPGSLIHSAQGQFDLIKVCPPGFLPKTGPGPWNPAPGKSKFQGQLNPANQLFF